MVKRKIIVGVSGGIDSALAVLRLTERGWSVVPVRLIMAGGALEDEEDRLRALVLRTGMPVMTVDRRRAFAERVIRPFVDAYRRGRTPNPCVLCNEALKVRTLLEIADSMGVEHVATGHYARVVRRNGEYALARSPSRKDQSYMLCRLPREWLPRLVFPLGDEADKDVLRRELGLKLGRSEDSTPESSGICFLRGEKLFDFLCRRIPPGERFEGRMTDEDGRDLGPHRGLIFYTEGQRKGLGLSGGPWFVARRDFSTSTLLLSRGEEKLCAAARFDSAVWQAGTGFSGRCAAQYCYRFPAVAARVTRLDGTNGIVEFERPAPGVSTGQALAFYDGDALLGGASVALTAETAESLSG